MYPRYIQDEISNDLNIFPAVFLAGPRQAGKSTLVRSLMEEQDPKGEYRSFDDITQINAAQNDPQTYIENLPRRAALDEVQRVPGIFSALKKTIDELRISNPESVKGRFFLTGSADIMLFPELADYLVGRMGLQKLLPLSAGEILGVKSRFPEACYKNKWAYEGKYLKIPEILSLAGKATYPAMVDSSWEERKSWLRNYISTVLLRDIKDFSNIEKIERLPDMLSIFAHYACGLLNEAAFARESHTDGMMFRRYHALINGLFLTARLPAWDKSLKKRMVKAPKIYFYDTNLLCFLLDVDLEKAHRSDPKLFGKIVENLVFSELSKQLTWHKDFRLYHFRTSDQKEVDFVLENAAGEVVGIEVKSSQSVEARDFRHIDVLKEVCGSKFRRGYVLYMGQQVAPFGVDKIALPLQSLWEMQMFPDYMQEKLL